MIRQFEVEMVDFDDKLASYAQRSRIVDRSW